MEREIKRDLEKERSGEREREVLRKKKSNPPNYFMKQKQRIHLLVFSANMLLNLPKKM